MASSSSSSGASSSSGGTTTFISQATCPASGCTTGTYPDATGIAFYASPPAACAPVGPIAPDPTTKKPVNIISVGMINDGTGASCRIFGYYRPNKLVGQATTVFLAPGFTGPTWCTEPTPVDGGYIHNTLDNEGWYALADQNRLVLVLLDACPRGNWGHDNILPVMAQPYNDAAYLQAVVAQAVNDPNIGADPARLILQGSSNGAWFAFNTACDPTTSTLFRGYSIVSGEMFLLKGDAGTPVPGTETCVGSNKDFFLIQVQGESDTTVPYNGGPCVPNGTCSESFNGTRAYLAEHLGCNATPTPTMFGTPNAVNVKYDYAGCGFGTSGAQYEAVAVPNGGHQVSGLDSPPNPTNGFSTAGTCWSFFSSRSW